MAAYLAVCHSNLEFCARVFAKMPAPASASSHTERLIGALCSPRLPSVFAIGVVRPSRARTLTPIWAHRPSQSNLAVRFPVTNTTR